MVWRHVPGWTSLAGSLLLPYVFTLTSFGEDAIPPVRLCRTSESLVIMWRLKGVAVDLGWMFVIRAKAVKIQEASNANQQHALGYRFDCKCHEQILPNNQTEDIKRTLNGSWIRELSLSYWPGNLTDWLWGTWDWTQSLICTRKVLYQQVGSSVPFFFWFWDKVSLFCQDWSW